MLASGDHLRPDPPSGRGVDVNAFDAEDHQWGQVEFAYERAPLHIMVPDVDYGYASLCKGRPQNGMVASGTDWPKVEQRCTLCVRMATE